MEGGLLYLAEYRSHSSLPSSRAEVYGAHHIYMLTNKHVWLTKVGGNGCPRLFEVGGIHFGAYFTLFPSV